jgi:hypothetical protein
VDAPRIRCQLVLADGVARRVGPAGLTIGRQPDCDLVTDDPVASRRHALVRLTITGAEVVPLGKGPVEVNGVATTAITALADGDRVAVPGLALAVQVKVARPDAAAAGFQLVRARGGSFGLSHSPFVVGGGAGDDLVSSAGRPARCVCTRSTASCTPRPWSAGSPSTARRSRSARSRRSRRGRSSRSPARCSWWRRRRRRCR